VQRAVPPAADFCQKVKMILTSVTLQKKKATLMADVAPCSNLFCDHTSRDEFLMFVV
jgi:hypothetical protein